MEVQYLKEVSNNRRVEKNEEPVPVPGLSRPLREKLGERYQEWLAGGGLASREGSDDEVEFVEGPSRLGWPPVRTVF